jgi:hypothetical protein
VKGASATPLALLALVAVCYAIGPAILQRWLSDLPPLGVIAASLGLVALVYVPIAVFSFSHARLRWESHRGRRRRDEWRG